MTTLSTVDQDGAITIYDGVEGDPWQLSLSSIPASEGDALLTVLDLCEFLRVSPRCCGGRFWEPPPKCCLSILKFRGIEERLVVNGGKAVAAGAGEDEERSDSASGAGVGRDEEEPELLESGDEYRWVMPALAHKEFPNKNSAFLFGSRGCLTSADDVEVWFWRREWRAHKLFPPSSTSSHQGDSPSSSPPQAPPRQQASVVDDNQQNGDEHGENPGLPSPRHGQASSWSWRPLVEELCIDDLVRREPNCVATVLPPLANRDADWQRQRAEDFRRQNQYSMQLRKLRERFLESLAASRDPELMALLSRREGDEGATSRGGSQGGEEVASGAPRCGEASASTVSLSSSTCRHPPGRNFHTLMLYHPSRPYQDQCEAFLVQLLSNPLYHGDPHDFDPVEFRNRPPLRVAIRNAWYTLSSVLLKDDKLPASHLNVIPDMALLDGPSTFHDAEVTILLSVAMHLKSTLFGVRSARAALARVPADVEYPRPDFNYFHDMDELLPPRSPGWIFSDTFRFHGHERGRRNVENVLAKAEENKVLKEDVLLTILRHPGLSAEHLNWRNVASRADVDHSEERSVPRGLESASDAEIRYLQSAEIRFRQSMQSPLLFRCVEAGASDVVLLAILKHKLLSKEHLNWKPGGGEHRADAFHGLWDHPSCHDPVDPPSVPLIVAFLDHELFDGSTLFSTTISAEQAGRSTSWSRGEERGKQQAREDSTRDEGVVVEEQEREGGGGGVFESFAKSIGEMFGAAPREGKSPKVSFPSRSAERLPFSRGAAPNRSIVATRATFPPTSADLLPTKCAPTSSDWMWAHIPSEEDRQMLVEKLRWRLERGQGVSMNE